MRTLLTTLISAGLSLSAIAQDVSYVKSLIDTLCSPHFDGRGYVNQGDVRAAEFLVNEAKSIGLEPINGAYTQPYALSVNTFPGKMKVKLDGEELTTGIDFIIAPYSKGIDATLKAVYVKPKWASSREKLFKLRQKYDLSKCIIVFERASEYPDYQALLSSLINNPLNAAAYLIISDKKLTWSVSRTVSNTTVLNVSEEAIKGKIKEVQLHVDQEYIMPYKSMNVMAQIPGEVDSTIVFTAHYDHLGRMGAETYIPGASDNASGSAMLFDLAKYYKEHPSKYTIQFIWFSGEEAGLRGSNYYVQNPVSDLEKIKFLLNLDLMADAKKGITAVNGKIFTDHFAKLSSINAEMGLLETVKARGKAANSDHYPFTEKGVPAFFIYTMGDYMHYHDINDKAVNVPMTNYGKVFKLITEFVELGL